MQISLIKTRSKIWAYFMNITILSLPIFPSLSHRGRMVSNGIKLRRCILAYSMDRGALNISFGSWFQSQEPNAPETMHAPVQMYSKYRPPYIRHAWNKMHPVILKYARIPIYVIYFCYHLYMQENSSFYQRREYSNQITGLQSKDRKAKVIVTLVKEYSWITVKQLL